MHWERAEQLGDPAGVVGLVVGDDHGRKARDSLLLELATQVSAGWAAVDQHRLTVSRVEQDRIALPHIEHHHAQPCHGLGGRPTRPPQAGDREAPDPEADRQDEDPGAGRRPSQPRPAARPAVHHPQRCGECDVRGQHLGWAGERDARRSPPRRAEPVGDLSDVGCEQAR